MSPKRISSTKGTTSGKIRSMTNSAAVTAKSLGNRRVDACRINRSRIALHGVSIFPLRGAKPIREAS